jgi:hypothetical protein
MYHLITRVACLCSIFVWLAFSPSVQAEDISILTHGAKADDIGLDTGAIQRALDEAGKKPGSRVIVPAGIFRTTQLNMPSHTTLHLEEKAVLESSARWEDWGEKWSFGYCVISAQQAENIIISGPGLIDGVDCYSAHGEENFRGPHTITLGNCKKVTFRDFTIQRSGNWAICCHHSQDILVEKVKIRGGHDGLHIQNCQRVIARECDFRTGDDAFAGCDNQDVEILSCQVNSSCEGMRLGAAGLTVKDSRFWGPGEYPHRSTGDRTLNSMLCYFSPSDRKPQIPGERIVIENCTVDGATSIVNYTHGLTWQDGQPLKDVTLRGVKGKNLKNGLFLTAHPENSLSLVIENCEIALEEKAHHEAAGIQVKNFHHITITDSLFDVRDDRQVGRFDTGEKVLIQRVTTRPGTQPHPWNDNWWGAAHGKKVTEMTVTNEPKK